VLRTGTAGLQIEKQDAREKLGRHFAPLIREVVETKVWTAAHEI
jgi:hypothetical protein